MSVRIGNIRPAGSAGVRVPGRSIGTSLALAALLLASLVAFGSSTAKFSGLLVQAPQPFDSGFDVLMPVTADDELFALREFERAEERFLTLVGPDHRSRLLRQKASFGLETANSTPVGGIHSGGLFSLALNPDRRLSKRAVQPRLVNGSHLPDFLAPANPASAEKEHRVAIRNADRAASLDARGNFTIDFICHLRRASSTSGASKTSDAPSSPVQGRIA